MKRALLLVAGNERLNELGVKIVATIHDEMLVEGPKEYGKEIAELVAGCMVKSGEGLDAPVSVDWVISERWYGEELDSGTYKEE